MKEKMLVFVCGSNKSLGKGICDYLNIAPANVQLGRFPDGEIDVKIMEDVRGADCYVVQSTCPPVNENLMELLITMDCLRRASADRITAVVPYFGYARQDRKAEGRVPITSKLVANLITKSGADRVLALDLHAAQIQGFFDIPTDHLFASKVFLKYVMENIDTKNLVIVSPDVGGTKMARAYAKRLNLEMAIVDKRRTGPEQVELGHIVGDVEGKDVLVVDDIIATGTSLMEGARILKKFGARDIHIAGVHPIFALNCAEKLKQVNPKSIIVTDTVPLPERVKGELPMLVVLSVGSLIGEAIKRIHMSMSVSEMFEY